MDEEAFKARLIKSFGERIRQLRLEKGMTQFDLAVKCGVDPRQISRVENGAGSPGLGTVGLLAMGLEISLSELFDFEVEED